MPDVDVFCFPSDDFAFERRVRQLAHLDARSTIAEVEAHLRLDYPRARLVLRARLADVIELNDRVTWYARRDGYPD